MLKIAVCDDESSAVSIVRDTVESGLRANGVEAQLTCYTSAEVLLQVIRTGTYYDLLLLDIDMPVLDGIELGIAVQELLQDSLLVYISNREERVFDAFRAKPFRFIRKSRLPEEWPGVMRDLADEWKRRSISKLILDSGGLSIALKPEEIIYVEALRKKQAIHTTRGVFDLTEGFESVVAQLDGRGFIRIHRSYAVNYRFIYTVNRTDVELDDGTLLPIGRSKSQAVQQEFHRLVLTGL